MTCLAGCSCETPTRQGASDAAVATGARELDAAALRARARAARIAERFPLHGLVTGTQLKVRTEPQPDALVLGWLRMGSRIHLAPKADATSTCRSGWHRVFPRGWACAGEGIEVGDAPPESALALNPPPKDAALPYSYYFVKENLVPEYHRLPSRDEQRTVARFVRRYLELREANERRAERMWNGELEREPKSPAVVRTYLSRGFYVAAAGVEVRAYRRFVRTVRGSYVKEAQLEPRSGSSFRGVQLAADRSLPVAWATRAARPFEVKQREDGSLAFVAAETEDPIPRHALVAWGGRERVGNRILHRLEDGRYLKHWFLAVAERIEPPSGVVKDEPWVHVSLQQQTLVLYRGAQPLFATLVSTGLPEHQTPEGVFTVRRKLLADTMSDLGPDAGEDSYRVEDVPWTQYFKGSLALHGAFWHDRFGLPRSHGCINLAPHDAHYVFDHTWPHVERGWHGVSTDRTGLQGSKIVVTQ